MKKKLFALCVLASLFLCDTVLAEDNSQIINEETDTDESLKNEKKQAKTGSQIKEMWESRNLNAVEYLSQKPEDAELSFFSKKFTVKLEPSKKIIGLSIGFLSGKLEETLTSKKSDAKLTLSEPKQTGTVLFFNIGTLFGKNKSGAFSLYVGSTTVSTSPTDTTSLTIGSSPIDTTSLVDESLLPNRDKTTTKVAGFEVFSGYNFNNLGVHSGIIIGGGFGFQSLEITDQKKLLSTTISKTTIKVSTFNILAKLGASYLFENNLYIEGYFRGELPLYSTNQGEYKSSKKLFMPAPFQATLSYIY